MFTHPIERLMADSLTGLGAARQAQNDACFCTLVATLVGLTCREDFDISQSFHSVRLTVDNVQRTQKMPCCMTNKMR